MIMRLSGSMSAEEMEKREKIQREKALFYLKERFPYVDEHVFFTDYTGQTFPYVVDAFAVAQAAEVNEICMECKGGMCGLPEGLKIRPFVRVCKSAKGYSYLEVRWTRVLGCKYDEQSVDFVEKYKKSGLETASQKKKFKNYETSAEVTEAKAEALRASEAGTNLILSGSPETGKTHLVIAIAIKAMKHGHQALFRLVSVMPDEIQMAIRDSGDYDGLMRKFKIVPCLVLDDLGHENMTSMRASYLHQIVDYRYRNELQTIITTNAKSVAELCEWDKEKYVKPIVSRLLERGKWVLIENAEDYRKKGGACDGK